MTMKSSDYYRALAAVVLLIIGVSSIATFYFINFHFEPSQVAHPSTICEVFGYYFEFRTCEDKCSGKTCSLKCFNGYIDLIRHDGHRVITTKRLISSNQTNKTKIIFELESKFPIGQLLKCDNINLLVIDSDSPQYPILTKIKLNILLVFIPFIFAVFVFYYCFIRNRSDPRFQSRTASSKNYKRF